MAPRKVPMQQLPSLHDWSPVETNYKIEIANATTIKLRRKKLEHTYNHSINQYVHNILRRTACQSPEAM